MIIGIDASRANRKYRSGTEWYSYYLIRELAKIDKDNQYILYTDSPLRPDLTDLLNENESRQSPRFDDDGYQAIRSPHDNFKAKILNWPWKFLWTQGRLALEMLFRAPDVLFVPAHTLPIFHPKNSVVTVHDVGFERDRTIYRPKQLGPGDRKSRYLMDLLVRTFTRGKFGANTLDYLAWSTIFGLKRARAVITVSNFSAREIQSVYNRVISQKDLDKVKVVHNGFNDALYKQASNMENSCDIIKKYGIKQPYLFYLGRIERKKNIPRLIEAFAQVVKEIPDLKLVLTGAASYGFDEVNYLISEFELEDKIIKTGWVDENDLPAIFSCSKGFVFPSLYEGFGIPLIQAMACGVPVACSNAPAITEVVEDAALIFDSQNIENMAECMKKLVKDQGLRDNLIKSGLEQSKKYSWKKTAEETLKILIEKDRSKRIVLLND